MESSLQRRPLGGSTVLVAQRFNVACPVCMYLVCAIRGGPFDTQGAGGGGVAMMFLSQQTMFFCHFRDQTIFSPLVDPKKISSHPAGHETNIFLPPIF